LRRSLGSVCTNHTRRSRRGRTLQACFGLRWPDTSMATQVRAQIASASGAFEMQKRWGDPWQRFPRTTPGGRVVDASRTRGLNFHFQILLSPPKYAREWPVQAAWLRCGHVWRTPGVGFRPRHTVVASWAQAVRLVWTSMARYVFGHPSKCTNGQCKRRV